MDEDKQLLIDAERVLVKALRDYRLSSAGSPEQEFYELRLQAAMFQYDLCYEFAALWRAEPKDFALKVALRNLVHKLYEYDTALASRIIKRIQVLAGKRHIDIDGASIRAEKKKWRVELSQLRRWEELRNQTSAHYGKDIERQVSLIDALNRDQVMVVSRAFINFNNFICRLLANVGRGRTFRG